MIELQAKFQFFLTAWMYASSVTQFDELQDAYRNWLCFNQYPV